MDIFEFLEKFNQALDAQRHEPFTSRGYPLRLDGIFSTPSLDDLTGLDEDAEVTVEGSLLETGLFREDIGSDWFSDVPDQPEELDLTARRLSGTTPVGNRHFLADSTYDEFLELCL